MNSADTLMTFHWQLKTYFFNLLTMFMPQRIHPSVDDLVFQLDF